MESLNTTMPATHVAGQPSFQVHLDDSLGAAFIGLISASILFGVTNVQSFIYYQNSARDPKYMKWTIAFLWTLDAFQLLLISHILYFYTVTNFTNLLIITKQTWSLCLQALVTTISDVIVRMYYARRVWIMSKQNRFLTAGALTFTFVTFVSGLGFGIKSFTFSSTLDSTKISWVFYTSLSSAVAADLWVAVSLCYFLAKGRTGFKKTDTMMNTLMLYTINTGLLTSLCAIGFFVSYAAMTHSYVFMAFYFSLSKFYFNSLLGTLNARERLREGTMEASGDVGTYQSPCVVHVGSPSSSKDTTSLDTGNATSNSLYRIGLGPEGEKVISRLCREGHGLDVDGRKEGVYRVDEVGITLDRSGPILPL